MNTQTNILASGLNIAPPPQHVIVEKKELHVKVYRNFNLVSIKGWSTGSDAERKYQSVLRFIDMHLAIRENLSVYFQYKTFNCSGAAYILKILKKLGEYSKNGKEITVYWMCSGDMGDMLEAGIDFREFSDLDFRIRL